MNAEQNKDDRRHYSENGAAAIAAALDILLVIYSVAVKSETNQTSGDPAAEVLGANNIYFIPDITIFGHFFAGSAYPGLHLIGASRPGFVLRLA